MALTKQALRDLYRHRANNYDISANLYYLIGFRENRYRKQAISSLSLNRGDTVVEVGCGTGLNFQYLLEHVGDTGRLIGIDLTDAMLEKARYRVMKNEWSNVNLSHCDAVEYDFPENVNGAISTFAITLIPEYVTIIEHASRALSKGGRIVILDLKKPQKWPLWLTKLGVAIMRPFGVSLDLAERKPWEIMEKYFHKVTMTEIYGGAVFIAVGEK